MKQQQGEHVRWFRWHWQNLDDENKYRRPRGWRQGRAWVYFGGACLSVEWGLSWRRQLMLTLGISDHYDRLGPGLGLRLPWGFLFVGFTARWLSGRLHRESETGFSLDLGSSKTLHLYFRADRMGDSRRGSKCLFLDDLILGRVKFTERDLETFPVRIPLPEGVYDGVATVKENTWKRPRWFAYTRISTWVEMGLGLPFPGKGENSWDCGEDALCGYGSDSTQYWDIVADGVRACLQNRCRYSRRDWRPAAAVPVSSPGAGPPDREQES